MIKKYFSLLKSLLKHQSQDSKGQNMFHMSLLHGNDRGGREKEGGTESISTIIDDRRIMDHQAKPVSQVKIWERWAVSKPKLKVIHPVIPNQSDQGAFFILI